MASFLPYAAVDQKAHVLVPPGLWARRSNSENRAGSRGPQNLPRRGGAPKGPTPWTPPGGGWGVPWTHLLPPAPERDPLPRSRVHAQRANRPSRHGSWTRSSLHLRCAPAPRSESATAPALAPAVGVGGFPFVTCRDLPRPLRGVADVMLFYCTPPPRPARAPLRRRSGEVSRGHTFV